ncbi:single-stranded DNA-binding protein [Actinocatenispora rupis]|uniref:Single-strand binding protein family protein n=1 Tax=Actinocatenispora rupis TaxID=519421 RepID=A0A8J3NGL4_9ACTN|nr:single-stranded DNA-binding protein [Actinocatenispora rupis]GID16085.1 hypothetical protein Aru02nite_69740 [Actinocatenispora rupis]
MSVSSLYVGRIPDGPVRDYTLDGALLARFAVCCPVCTAPPGITGGTTEDEVSITVEAAGPLAEEVLRHLRAGDRVLVVGGLASSPPDPTRRGATDLYVRAVHVGLDLTTAGWRRDPVPVPSGAAATGHPEYHW